MRDVANAFIFVFASLFPVVNPVGAAPLFLSITGGRTEAQRARLAFCAAFNGFWLLLGSMLFGSIVLEFFGITVPVVRVAGGLLVTAMGWKLLNETGRSTDGALVETSKAASVEDGFFPLTLPLTVGARGDLGRADDRQSSSLGRLHHPCDGS